MTQAEYKVLSKRTDAHWFCAPCEKKALRNMMTEKAIEERCKDHFQAIESRMAKMEMEIEKKTSEERVKELINVDLLD